VRTATAFFVDDSGRMLTARHAVNDCTRVVVSKEGRIISAQVVALAADSDLALIKVAKTLGLSAVFPRSAEAVKNEMVFAADYDTLPAMLAHGGSLANAIATSSASAGEAGHIALNTNITFGSSGAPVLDSRGLVEGVVSRKTTVNRILAVGAGLAKAFLTAEGVHFQQDDRPQISGGGSRAHRAASISATVTCLQH
jgi:S1-C subfamily serine protease